MPTRSKYTRLASVRLDAAGAGSNPAASSFARMNASIGLRTQFESRTVGGDGFTGFRKAHCTSLEPALVFGSGESDLIHDSTPTISSSAQAPAFGHAGFQGSAQEFDQRALLGFTRDHGGAVLFASGDDIGGAGDGEPARTIRSRMALGASLGEEGPDRTIVIDVSCPGRGKVRRSSRTREAPRNSTQRVESERHPPR